MTLDGGFILSGDRGGNVRLWYLDWDLGELDGEWPEAANRWLELTATRTLETGRSGQRVTIEPLVATLAGVGLGWLPPEEVASRFSAALQQQHAAGVVPRPPATVAEVQEIARALEAEVLAIKAGHKSEQFKVNNLAAQLMGAILMLDDPSKSREWAAERLRFLDEQFFNTLIRLHGVDPVTIQSILERCKDLADCIHPTD